MSVQQVDVTSKTEGKAFADATGVPLLVKYDTRLRDQVAKGIVDDITTNIEVSATWAARQLSMGHSRAMQGNKEQKTAVNIKILQLSSSQQTLEAEQESCNTAG